MFVMSSGQSATGWWVVAYYVHANFLFVSTQGPRSKPGVVMTQTCHSPAVNEPAGLICPPNDDDQRGDAGRFVLG